MFGGILGDELKRERQMWKGQWRPPVAAGAIGRGCGPRDAYLSNTPPRAALSVLSMSMQMVIGPTPPGTGEM